ncbi:NAD(P)/FAD-dependent oxidoreductase [Alkalibacterium sp. s-m-22]|uniref:Ferredoxin--NADP reductase n=1 Tax=Alkalibacterium indicireducens TaxID=398758 RepID=A0ABP3KNN1_9LACT
MDNTKITDCTIIGGGPAGLYASFYAGMRDLSVRLIEVKETLGGKLHFYPEKRIWDIGGMPPTHGADVMSYLKEQGTLFDPEIILKEKIVNIEKLKENLFKVISESGACYYSRSVIIAVGGGLVSPRKLAMHKASHYEQTNLHYRIFRIEDFSRKKVVIVGGGNSAIDWANELKETADELHLIHRNDTFRAHESQLRKLKESNVAIHSYTSIETLIPDDQGTDIQAIEVRNSQTGQLFTLSLDELIVNIGFDSEPNFYQEKTLKLNLKDNYYIEGNTQMQTSVEGIYAIGDIVDYEGKVRLIAGAFQDAINAVNQIKSTLLPAETPEVIMSSFHKGLQEK